MPVIPRQHPRCPGRLAVDVRLGSWAEFARLYTKDLSCGGLFVETDDPADVFSTVEVKVHLPEGAGVIALAAKVVRAVPADCAPPGVTPGMGLQFTEVTEQQQRQLGAWFELQGRAALAPSSVAVGQGTLPSITESELPVVPAGVHQALEAKLASLTGEPFEVLGLPRGTDPAELRRRYLAQAKKYHPQRWLHYEDEEIDQLVVQISDILARAYEKARVSLEERQVGARAPVGRPAVDSRYRQTHADLSDFASGVREVRPCPPEAPVQAQISEALKHLALKHYDVARAALQQVLERAPDNKAAKTWIRVAEARQRAQGGDEAGAVAIYREILEEIDPAHGEALKVVRASSGRLSSLFRRITGR